MARRAALMAIVVSVVLALPGAVAHATPSALRTAFDQTGQRIAASSATGIGHFGLSVALSEDGTTALAGAPEDNSGHGAVAVFTRSGASFVQQGPKLTTSDAGRLGQSVALSADGNIAVIGGGEAAIVFTRTGSTWNQTAKLTPNDAAPNMVGNTGFGGAVAVSADGATALIGGGADTRPSGSGAAWVFTRSGAAWTQQGSKLLPTGESGSSSFGQAVALSDDGNTALIGAPSDHSSDGAAYVFTRSMSAWSQQGAKLTATASTGSDFGFSLALSSDGNRALVGAPFDGGSVGAAWPFARSGSAWSNEGPKLTPSDGSSPHFGWGVALTNDASSAAIGGITDNNVGAAWAFSRSGTTWSQEGLKATGNGEVGSGEFGLSVALSANGGTALVGGPYDSGPGGGPPGAVWAFGGSGSPVQFSSDQYSVSESVAAGHATITVQRGGSSTGQVTVHYATSNGTATAGSDYTSTSGTLTWADGDNTDKTFDVPITNDGTHENAETVSLTLSSPGGNASLGTQSTATLTITDDDAASTVHLSSSTYSANESAGTLTISVVRDPPATGTASVDFATSDGTATDGSDYTGGSGTVNFADGETSQALVVSINNDGLHESDETFHVTLSNPAVSTVLGSPSSATATITDDDPIDTSITDGPSGPTNDSTPTFTFAADPAANASFVCWLDNGSPGPCTSPLTTVPLAGGAHTLHVRASNTTDTDPSPATRDFFVDTVPPTSTVTIAAGPSGEHIGSGQTYAGTVFMITDRSDPDPSAGVAETRCVLDPAAPPASFDDIPPDECPLVTSSVGEHTYYAASRDNAGNAEAPHAHRFTIVPSPDTTITSGPTGVSYSAPTFTFSSDVAEATFECRVDSSDWSPCGSPTTRYGLSLGTHTFYVRAVSPAGAHDPSPASQSFTLGKKILSPPRCEARVPWNDSVICPILRDTCPVNSKCTVRGSVSIDSADTGISWDAFLEYTFGGSAGGGTNCSSNRDQVRGPAYPPCPRSASAAHFGRGDVIDLRCGEAQSTVAATGHKHGPDDARVLFCQATLTIEPGATLEALPDGSSISTIAPSAGSLRISTSTLGATRIVAAAKKKKVPLIRPVRVTVKKPGPVRIPLTLSKTAKRTLARRHKLPLRIKISFLAKGAENPTVKAQRIILTSITRRHCKPTKRIRCR